MDKLTMAHEYALKQMESLSENSTMQSLVSVAWQYADAMQAEADKRVNKERPEALTEEWQPDWSQAPEWANWWAMDKDHTANFFRGKPEITNGNGWDFGGVMQSNNSHNYQGNWQDSLRKRPQ